MALQQNDHIHEWKLGDVKWTSLAVLSLVVRVNPLWFMHPITIEVKADPSGLHNVWRV